MLFSYNWLQSFFDKKLPEPNVLADLLTRRSFEVEGTKRSGLDTVLDIAVLSNRASDCFSHIGMARECAAILGLRQKPAASKKKIASGAKPVRALINIKVDDVKLCPRYCAKMIEGVKIGSSPKWVQERLIACGLRPINNIVDAANYVMLELGQPLHTFDYEKIAFDPSHPKTKTINIRLARKGEKIEALDDKTYALNESMLLIADAKGPLVIAGIKGGRRAEISENTKTIIIESANFNRQSIRRTSRTLGLRTDASARYEHGLDPNMAQVAIERAAGLIAQLAGGQVLTGMVDFYPTKVIAKWLTLDLVFAQKLLGTTVVGARAKKILEALGFSVRKGKGSNIEALVPTFRLDVNLPQDLIEEIGRIGGYENIGSVLPQASLVVPKKNYPNYWIGVIRQAFKEAGFWEAYCYSFVKENDWKAFGYRAGDILRVANPLNIDFEFLRPDLLINLIKKFAAEPKTSTKFFEIGRVFGKNQANQPYMAGAVLGGNFYEAKAAVELIARRLNLEIEFRPAARLSEADGVPKFFDNNASALIYCQKKAIGIVGQIESKLSQGYGCSKPPLAFELKCDTLFGLASQIVVYRPQSAYPPSTRDLAVLVPDQTYAGDVVAIIKKAAGPLLGDVQVFEAYEGKGVAAGQKNVALALTFQSYVKTLVASEVEALMKDTIEALENEAGWKVRK